MNTQRLPVIGHCKLTDKDAFMAFLQESGWRRRYSFGNSGLHGGWFDDNWQNYFYKRQQLFSGITVKNIFHDVVTEDKKRKTEEFFDMLSYLSSIHQRLEVYYADDFAVLAGYNECRYVLPAKFLEIEYLKDYSHLPVSSLNKLGNAGSVMNLPAAMEDTSVQSLKSSLSMNDSRLLKLQSAMQDIEDGNTDELKKLQAEIDKQIAAMEEKKQEMLQALREKQSKLEQIKADMEKKLFLLETQIYGIRCYLGETIRLHQICAGNNAPLEEPIILYQKIRFLDEELGKAAAIYQVDGSDTDTFVDILRYRNDIRELFVPSTKCISLVRITKAGTHVRQSAAVENILERYEAYHGGQLGVLLRNGDNLYISWLEADKITVYDGNAFYGNKTDTDKLDDSFRESQSSKEEVASRYFIFALLQGILDNSTILEIPERTSILNGSSPYIHYSLADGWLADNRYGTFGNIIDRVSSFPLKKGDYVLTTLLITRDDAFSERYRKYNNDRGIGIKNRTHDASIGRLKIYPINKVVRTAHFKADITEYKVIKETEKVPHPLGGYSICDKRKEVTDEIIRTYSNSYEICDADELINLNDKNRASLMLNKFNQMYGRDSGQTYYVDDAPDNVCALHDYTNVYDMGDTYQYYLSAVKNDSIRFDKPAARANLEIMKDEVIPLTYLNSEWIRYTLVTKNIGTWYVGDSLLTYADSLIYLNKMLEFLLVREKEEYSLLAAAGLSTWLENHPDWMVTLCEWRIERQIRSLTPSKSTAFAKFILSNE